MSETSTFRDRLNNLFSTVHPAGRGAYTLQEAADGINAGGITTISISYLSQLRSGQRDNPTGKTIEAIARFFQVPTMYFFDDAYAEQLSRDLALLGALRDAGVRRLAARALDLSPQGRAALESVVEALRTSEGLPQDESPA